MYIYNIYIYYIYVYIYTCLYATKLSYYLEPSGILFVLCSKIIKMYVKNNASKNTSSNEIKDRRIQLCKTPSKKSYSTDFFFPFKIFQQQFNLISSFEGKNSYFKEFVPFI